MATKIPASSIKAPVAPAAPAEGAIARFLIAPLTFLSFLLSLAIIDNANSSSRLNLHRPESSTWFSKIRGFFTRMLYKESPYAYVRNPDGEMRKVQDEEWYWHNNQRKMMRMEMVQAFDMRKWVLVMLIIGGLCVGAVVGWGGRLILEEARRKFW